MFLSVILCASAPLWQIIYLFKQPHVDDGFMSSRSIKHFFISPYLYNPLIPFAYTFFYCKDSMKEYGVFIDSM